jgi:hypothetical protein
VAIAVPVVMAAATPSPAVRPAVTVRPVADDKGGQTKAKAKDDTATTKTVLVSTTALNTIAR